MHAIDAPQFDSMFTYGWARETARLAASRFSLVEERELLLIQLQLVESAVSAEVDQRSTRRATRIGLAVALVGIVLGIKGLSDLIHSIGATKAPLRPSDYGGVGRFINDVVHTAHHKPAQLTIVLSLAAVFFLLWMTYRGRDKAKSSHIALSTTERVRASSPYRWSEQRSWDHDPNVRNEQDVPASTA